MDLGMLAPSLPRLKPVNGQKLTIQRTQAGIAFPAKTDHLAFIPPPLAGLPFFAMSLYTGNPITT